MQLSARYNLWFVSYTCSRLSKRDGLPISCLHVARDQMALVPQRASPGRTWAAMPSRGRPAPMPRGDTNTQARKHTLAVRPSWHRTPCYCDRWVTSVQRGHPAAWSPAFLPAGISVAHAVTVTGARASAKGCHLPALAQAARTASTRPSSCRRRCCPTSSSCRRSASSGGSSRRSARTRVS